MPGARPAKSAAKAKIARTIGPVAHVSGPGTGGQYNGKGGFKPGNKYGAKPGGPKEHTYKTYARHHGISESRASDHLRSLYDRGHASAGSVGGSYKVHADAPLPRGSIAKNRDVIRTSRDVHVARRRVESAKRKLAAHDGGRTPEQQSQKAHLDSLGKVLKEKQGEVAHHKARLAESEARIAKLKATKTDSEKSNRAKLAADIRAARKTTKDKDDRQTFARHAKMLRDHRQGKKTITKEHAKVIRDRFRAHGEGAVKPPTVRQQAEAHRAGKDTAARIKAVHDRIKARSSDRRDPSTHTDHEPGHVGMLDTSLIHTDPHRFQYKIGSDETGSVGSLAGVRKYDHNLGGVVQVWKDHADGKTYVVNGHNRLDLAKKLGAGKITVRYLDAANHKEARSIGALTNIAEGRGTAIDAAKYFKDTHLTPEQIADKGIPLREKVATDGIALSHLSKPIFDKVIDGDLPIERAAIIGKSGLSHDEQNAIFAESTKKYGGKSITNSHLKEMIDTAKSARSVRTKTTDLFGSHESDHSLALHKSKIQDVIKERLSKEKKLFGIVAKSKHAEELAKAGNTIDTAESGKVSEAAAQTLGVFDRLKNLSGPVSRSLNDAAERIHAGENAKKVTDETYRRILKDIPAMLAGGKEFAA